MKTFAVIIANLNLISGAHIFFPVPGILQVGFMDYKLVNFAAEDPNVE
jgi:hypothetical protein